jgi:hypothetical protein
MVLRSLKDNGYTSITEQENMIDTQIAMERQRQAKTADKWEILEDNGGFLVGTIEGDEININRITEF